MGNYNYNKKFRQSIYKIDKVIKEKLGFSIHDNSIIFVPETQVFSEYSKREMNIIDSIKKMVCYSDLYTSLALNEKCKAITFDDEKIFEMVKNVKSFNEWESIYDQSLELREKSINQILNFYNSSAFHKILRIKCLSEDDINQIQKINTMFDQDLEEYKVNVDVDYIINKILKMINSGYTEHQILNESTEFISIIGKVDKKLYKKIILELIKRDIKVSNYVQIYEYNKLNKDMLENLKGILTKLQIYKENDIENCIKKMKFQHIKLLLNSSIFYQKHTREIDEKNILEENLKILEKIKKEEKKDE